MRRGVLSIPTNGGGKVAGTRRTSVKLEGSRGEKGFESQATLPLRFIYSMTMNTASSNSAPLHSARHT